MAITVAIADDHPLITEGLKAIIEAEDDLDVVAVCHNGEDTLNALKKYQPDLLLVDLHMPGNHQLEVLREAQNNGVKTRMVLLTAQLDDDELSDAVRLGARGLVLKTLAPKLILRCLRDVHLGKLWLEKESVSAAFEGLLKGEMSRNQVIQVLTQREIEIVKAVAIGLRNREIGKRLNISEGTVKIHLHNIYQKLGVDGRFKLTRFAQEKKLL